VAAGSRGRSGWRAAAGADWRAGAVRAAASAHPRGPDKLYRHARFVSTDVTGRNYQIAVPLKTAISLNVASTVANVFDQNGNQLPQSNATGFQPAAPTELSPMGSRCIRSEREGAGRLSTRQGQPFRSAATAPSRSRLGLAIRYVKREVGAATVKVVAGGRPGRPPQAKGEMWTDGEMWGNVGREMWDKTELSQISAAGKSGNAPSVPEIPRRSTCTAEVGDQLPDVHQFHGHAGR